MQIAEQIADYRKQFQTWFDTYFSEKKLEPITHRCCINLANNVLSILHINKTQGTIEPLLSETLQYENQENLTLILKSAVEKHELNLMPAYWLLNPDDYQLFLIDSLQVKKDEFNSALNWRVRSLINYPIAESVIDYFNIPPKKTAPDKMVVAAAVAKKSQLDNIISIFKKCELPLTTIYIPELALRNLTSAIENDEKSTAFIYFYDNTVILNITRAKILYFTRRIALQTTAQPTSGDYEKVALEILRYCDYFQSQWRHPTPSRMFIAYNKDHFEDAKKSLSEYLSASIDPFPLNTIIPGAPLTSLIEKKYLLSLGCAMKEDVTDAATGN